MNKDLMKRPECKEGSTQTNVVTEIRQYHGVVIHADKTIDGAGREQIRAAFKCGQLLEKQRATVKSGHWGRFCKRCGMSEDTAGRYIKLCNSAGLRELIRKYRTLNSAYQGEGITSPQRQRITVTAVSATPTPVRLDSEVKPPVADRSEGEGTTGSAEVNSAPSNGDGNDGIDNPEKRPSDIITAKRYANKLCQLLDTTEDKQAMINAIQHLIDEISEYVRLKAEQERRTAEDAEFDKEALAA